MGHTGELLIFPGSLIRDGHVFKLLFFSFKSVFYYMGVSTRNLEGWRENYFFSPDKSRNTCYQYYCPGGAPPCLGKVAGKQPVTQWLSQNEGRSQGTVGGPGARETMGPFLYQSAGEQTTQGTLPVIGGILWENSGTITRSTVTKSISPRSITRRAEVKNEHLELSTSVSIWFHHLLPMCPQASVFLAMEKGNHRKL